MEKLSHKILMSAINGFTLFVVGTLLILFAYSAIERGKAAQFNYDKHLKLLEYVYQNCNVEEFEQNSHYECRKFVK
jgi:hypothetical protein